MPRSPLLEKARAAVEAWERATAGSELVEAMDELRREIREIDAALSVLDSLGLSDQIIRPHDYTD